jgi:hypothetical protein
MAGRAFPPPQFDASRPYIRRSPVGVQSWMPFRCNGRSVQGDAAKIALFLADRAATGVTFGSSRVGFRSKTMTNIANPVTNNSTGRANSIGAFGVPLEIPLDRVLGETTFEICLTRLDSLQ